MLRIVNGPGYRKATSPRAITDASSALTTGADGTAGTAIAALDINHPTAIAKCKGFSARWFTQVEYGDLSNWES